MTDYDVAVIGGGPTGATAANELASQGHRVLLLDRQGRIKPCGGAIPPILVREFDIPESQLEAKVTLARMISPSGEAVDMDIGGWVGMVDRGSFDEWLRERAHHNGATRINGKCDRVESAEGKPAQITFTENDSGEQHTVTARYVIGADGARSRVARACIKNADKVPHVFAYHEIIESPPAGEGDFDPERCDVYYQGDISPDFYGWVFPHGECSSVGMGTHHQGYSLRNATSLLRQRAGLAKAKTIRTEGAPIPLKPMKRWDNGRDVIVAGDAAGVVAPASGEGIYYAMYTGKLAAESVAEALETGDARALRKARKQFGKAHGRVFFILGILQKFWYSSDKRREKFVKICRDPDVQHLTWEAYMNKKLVRAKPVAHVRIFFKDLAHLVGLAPR
ncbi:MAG: geranylgeranyl diphosphate reductase [Pseudomonadota bacterium]